MAFDPVSPGSRPANAPAHIQPVPSDPPQDRRPTLRLRFPATRRGFIGIGAAVTAAAATAPRALAAGPVGAWWALKARHDAAAQKMEEFFERVMTPAWDAATAEIAQLPHTTVEIGNGCWRNGGEQTSPRSTADRHYVDDCRRQLRRFTDDRQCANPETPGRMRELIAAYDRRAEMALEVEAKHRVPEYESEDDRLSQIAYDLERELIKMPAPDRAALLWKLEAMHDRELPIGDHEMVLADARRLLGSEA